MTHTLLHKLAPFIFSGPVLLPMISGELPCEPSLAAVVQLCQMRALAEVCCWRADRAVSRALNQDLGCLAAVLAGAVALWLRSS